MEGKVSIENVQLFNFFPKNLISFLRAQEEVYEFNMHLETCLVVKSQLVQERFLFRFDSELFIHWYQLTVI